MPREPQPNEPFDEPPFEQIPDIRTFVGETTATILAKTKGAIDLPKTLTRAVPVAVVDASAILAILFGEPDASRVVERLGATDLAAPSLLPYEIMNAAATKR